MYSHNNPYAQAGWRNTHSYPSNGQPSVFGALPGHFDVPKGVAIGTGPLEFRLQTPVVGGYPSILNSTLMTPKNTPYLEIVTDRNITYIRNLSDQTCIASIEWGPPATITIAKQFSRYPARQWLAPSHDGGHTLLSQENKPYKWMRETRQISLYSMHMVQEALASIQRDQHSVILNLTSEAAVKVSMLSLVISTVLLQSGRMFD